jgi:hypothetical protein
MPVNETHAATRRNPALDAYRILRFGFVVAPILLGLDKFFNLLTQWPKFVSPIIANQLPPETVMRLVGPVELAAGVLVWIRPRIGALVVAAWLFLIIVNLLLIPGYYDVAVRDFGLMLGALALARLAVVFGR